MGETFSLRGGSHFSRIRGLANPSKMEVQQKNRAAHAAERSKRPKVQPLTPLRCVRGSERVGQRAPGMVGLTTTGALGVFVTVLNTGVIDSRR